MKRGFTLIELMLAVAIIGILAAVALPMMGEMIRRSQEGTTRGNLGTLRSALSIYYGDTEGVYPNDNLNSLFAENKYLDHPLIKYTPPYHPPGYEIGNGTYTDMITSHAAWFYVSDNASPDFGKVVVNCVHQDLQDRIWSSY
jgi:prepilin-type N-terminal cleavage/methylation domain-containing protein